MLDVTRAYGLDLLFPAKDIAVGGSLRVYGEFARIEQDLLADYLLAALPGPMIDVGANIGALCLPLAKRFPGRRFFAIEAHRGLAGLLAANALNNGLYNVEVFHAAASSGPGLLLFSGLPLSNAGNFGTLSFDTEGPKEEVRALTLDSFAPPNTRLVKIDVEGHEERVLAGASRVLREVRPIVLLEVAAREPQARASLFEPLIDAGYRLHWFWSPFVTGLAPKAGPEKPRLQGDTYALALPEGAPNLWDLPVIDRPDAEPPKRASALPYAVKYGLAR